jgi:hypothetical protein
MYGFLLIGRLPEFQGFLANSHSSAIYLGKQEKSMLRPIYFSFIFLVCLAVPHAARAESAADVIDRMMDAEAGYYAGIENMFSVSRSMGHRVPEYFEWDSGFWRSVPLSELMEREQPNEMSQASPDQLRAAADLLRRESTRVDRAVEQEIADSGLNSGAMGQIITMASNPPEQWLTSSPGGMMRLYGTMLDAGADAKEQMAAEQRTNVDENFENLEQIERLKSDLRIIGRSEIEGYPVIELGADNLDLRQGVEDGEFTTDSVRIMVDTAMHLPRQIRFEGTLKQGKESRDIVIERTDSVFMSGDNCGDLMRPRKSVMRLSGALSPAEQAEMEAAQQQLASLPPEQLEMMKQMMGAQQFEMIENMASGNGIEMVTDVISLRCNSAPPDAEELAELLR